MPEETTISRSKNRRARQRRRPRGKVKVSCFKGDLDLGPNLAVGVADVSEAGILLLLNANLEKGQCITLLLEGREHMRPIKLQGKVIWCIPMDNNVFRVGIALDHYLRNQDFLKIT